MRKLLATLPVLLLLLLSACTTPAKGITVEDAWIRFVPESGAGGINTAAFFVIKNNGDTAVRLTGADIKITEVVEIHETTMTGDIMSMRKVIDVEIPAGGEVAFKPGGYHLMLIDLKQAIAVGDEVTINLVFEDTKIVSVDAQVRE